MRLCLINRQKNTYFCKESVKVIKKSYYHKKNNTKWGKWKLNTATKKRWLLIHRTYLQAKEVEILTKFYDLEDSKIGIGTEFRTKVAQHKKWLWCWLLILMFFGTRSFKIHFGLLTCYHCTILQLTFENFFCLPGKMCYVLLKRIYLYGFQACK